MSRGVPVLLYHHINDHAGDTVTVTPEVFAGQMQLLAAGGYTTLSLADLHAYVTVGRRVAERAVVITFDDGWLDNYLFAYPTLFKYRFTAASFLITSRVSAARVTVLPDRVPLHAEAKQLAQSDKAGRVVMDWEIVRQLQRGGLMEFHSHTLTHRRSTSLAPGELVNELVRSKTELEVELGRPCTCLCWPYGDQNEATVTAACAAGYRTLFTTVDGFARPGSDPCQIPRIEVRDSVDWLRQRLLEGEL